MLTGNAEGGEEPLAMAIFGGREAAGDVGHGPARLMSPREAQAVASALESIDEPAFGSRYDPPAVKARDIHLADMCVRDGDDASDYVAGCPLSLRDFYRDAAGRGDGVVPWVSSPHAGNSSWPGPLRDTPLTRRQASHKTPLGPSVRPVDSAGIRET